MEIDYQKLIDTIQSYKKSHMFGHSPYTFVSKDNIFSNLFDQEGYSSGTFQRPCYFSVPNEYKKSSLAFVTPSTIKDSILNREYLSFLLGEESPWIEYKHLLFPDINNEFNTNSFDFRLNIGMIHENLQRIPCNLLINFSKAYRGIDEHKRLPKNWKKLVSMGATKRQAFFLAHRLIETVENYWTYNSIYHSCFNYENEYWNNQFARVSSGQIDSKKFTKFPNDSFSFAAIDKIWDTPIKDVRIFPICNVFNRQRTKIKHKDYSFLIEHMYTYTTEELTKLIESINV